MYCQRATSGATLRISNLESSSAGSGNLFTRSSLMAKSTVLSQNGLRQCVADLVPLELVRFDEPMSHHTSFRIGGPADVFLTPRSFDDLRISSYNGCYSKLLCFCSFRRSCHGLPGWTGRCCLSANEAQARNWQRAGSISSLSAGQGLA